MTLLDKPQRPPSGFTGSLRARNAHTLDLQCLVKAGGSDGFGGDGPMGKISGGDQDRPTLSLVGNFQLADPDGQTIRIPEKKGRVLLAMLATAPDQRRSREWLKSRLWGRSFDDQASNSLRQSLYALRKQLGPWSDLLQADYEHVWLKGIRIEKDPGSNARIGFFEDAPRLDEDGEDWLRDERQAFETRVEDDRGTMVGAGDVAPIAPVTFDAPPCVLIGSPVVIADDNLAKVVAERITNSLATTFRHNGYIDTYDLRDMESNQLAGRHVESVLRPPVLVEVRVALFARELQITVLARVPATGKVIWTSSIGTDWDTAISISSQTLNEFVMGAVDSVESVVMRQPEHTSRPTLYAAVHQLFALSQQGIVDASTILGQFDGPQYSANAQAWKVFATGLLLGESHNPHDDAVQLAEEAIAKALELEPSNAIVLALAGHHTGFVKRDLQQARELLADSRRIVPNLAFAWDASAMHAIYASDLNYARDAADIARRLGRYSPYRFYYDSSSAIVFTLMGEHDKAIHLGKQILAKRPDFLPVMRHLVASYALSGQTEEATDLYRRLRELDPAFGTEAMLSPTYVLPSKKSREIISDGLREIDLLDFRPG